MVQEKLLVENFISHNECDDLLKIALDTFVDDKRTITENWYAKTNENKEFENRIHKLISPLLEYDFEILWINLTEYENNRKLKPHKDTDSSITFVIPLTDGYEGGEFILSDKEYILGKGDCIYFNGKKTAHGVNSVTEGYRASLNVWTRKINPITLV